MIFFLILCVFVGEVACGGYMVYEVLIVVIDQVLDGCDVVVGLLMQVEVLRSFFLFVGDLVDVDVS